MSETNDTSTTSLKGDASRRASGFPTAAVASLVVAGGLVPALMYVANWGLWETVWFVKHWGYLIALTLFVGLCVGVLAWLSFRHRGWWFLSIPAIVMWLLISALVVVSRLPHDDVATFAIRCATVRRGETIEAFTQRMIRWGYAEPESKNQSGLPCVVFTYSGDKWFYVYFDSETRRIIRWVYISV